MRKTSVYRIIGIAMVLLGSFGAAEAQDGEANAMAKLDATISALTENMVNKWMDDEQAALLKTIAHQQAVSAFCEKFDVDQARLSEAMARVYPGGSSGEHAPDALPEFEKAAMFAYGTYLGSQLAIISRDVKGACAHAEEEREDPAANHLIWSAKK